MSVKYLSKIESDTITETAIKIPFEFNNRDSVPPDKNPGDCIVIRPITVRTWFRIRPLLLSLNKEDLGKMIAESGKMNNDFAAIMDKYGELLMDIVCLGIHNRKNDPPEWFRQVLMDNSTWEDVRVLLNAILYRIGFFPFCNSITMLRNVSPIRETEIIAAQENLTSWQDIAKQDS